MGSAASPPPRRRGPFRGRGDFSPASGGVKGRRSRGLSPASHGPAGGSGGRGRGGSHRGSPPPSSGGVACGPQPWPPFIAGVSLPGIHARPGPFRSPGRRGRPGRPPVGQSGGGGGGWPVRRTSSGARPGGPAAQGAGRSPCCGLSLRPPWVGPKAGGFVCAPPSELHWLTPECRHPVAAQWVLLRAGAGLPACRGHCRSGWAGDWRHAAYSSACCGSGASPWVSRPSRGGVPPRARRGGAAGLPSH